MNLVIVESPTKARTIQRFLSADFAVRSSFGHVRDLPKKELGVDTEHNFKPKYVVPLLARKRLTEIKKALPKAKKIILATDEDREGEAIAWHLVKALDLDEIENQKSKIKNFEGFERIVFHEITKTAIEEALKNPRQIDMNLVDAQQARRVLDRLVGYELSPFLWQKVAKGLSAGRVQSVAVRLIVEREREIQKFKSEEYWTIEALLRKFPISSDKVESPRQSRDNFQFPNKSQIQNPNIQTEFTAILIKQNSKQLDKLEIKNEASAKKIVDDLEDTRWKVQAISSKDVQKYPAPPFTTSTLQQEAVKKLRFSAKQTMQIAQQLYEGVELGKEGSAGLITYMRTDSTNLSVGAVGDIRNFIKEQFGDKYLPENAKIYKTKTKGAQEAHEAIRPTDIRQIPEKIKSYLTPQQFKLYGLIWKRTAACQMNPAIMATATADIEAKRPTSQNSYIFRANGSQIKFDGFLKVYDGKIQETVLPPLEKDEPLDLCQIIPSQHFTQPPSRYSEATLIKELEKNGIGRPSTYAPTISTIQERNYVQKNEDKKLAPTEIGFTVNDLLVEHFPQIVDLKFTARLEENLDKIAGGQEQWVPVIREFYEPFKKNLIEKYDEVKKQKPEPEPTDKVCSKCGSPLVIRTSRFGKFYACLSFPKCRYTENLNNNRKLGVYCPKCVEGEMVVKKTKRGKIFYACSRYPECDFALWDKPTGEKCPQCGSLLVETKSNKTKCSNKDCRK
ncbi:MAG: DNA topoisomerase I [Parcubacteria group bacterium LiPW_39]|nr:MAG: DNA topoisomerase I [Parcubacteria group bacterium LiPW_39]